MGKIPKEIKKQIEAEAMQLYPHDDESNKIDRDRFLDGAKFGYVLGRNALELIEDLLHKSELACEQYCKELEEANDTIIQLTKFAENREQ